MRSSCVVAIAARRESNSMSSPSWLTTSHFGSGTNPHEGQTSDFGGFTKVHFGHGLGSFSTALASALGRGLPSSSASWLMSVTNPSRV
jgi:hypothetical protein